MFSGSYLHPFPTTCSSFFTQQTPPPSTLPPSPLQGPCDPSFQTTGINTGDLQAFTAKPKLPTATLSCCIGRQRASACTEPNLHVFTLVRVLRRTSWTPPPPPQKHANPCICCFLLFFPPPPTGLSLNKENLIGTYDFAQIHDRPFRAASGDPRSRSGLCWLYPTRSN